MPTSTKTRKSRGQAAKDAEALRDIALRAYKGDDEKADRFVDVTMRKLGHTRRVEYDDTPEKTEEPENPDQETDEDEEDEEFLDDDEEESEPEPTRRSSQRYFGRR